MKTFSRIAITLLVALPLCAAMSSCQGIAWALASFTPPQKVKPLYTPDGTKKVLVFVDDARYPVTYEPIKRELAQKISEQLMAHKLAAEIIPYEQVMRLRDDTGSSGEVTSAPASDVATSSDTARRFENMDIVTVGRRTGAQVVLYVEITAFRLKDDPGSPMWEGRLATSVRWVNVAGKNFDEARLWPKDAPRTTGFDVPPVGMPAKEDLALNYGMELARNLAEQMADRITKLFYEHEVPAQGEEAPSDMH